MPAFEPSDYDFKVVYNTAPPLPKPPLGLMPREQWDEACRCNRVGAILDAMKRYNESAKAIPKDWFDELRELAERD